MSEVFCCDEPQIARALLTDTKCQLRDIKDNRSRLQARRRAIQELLLLLGTPYQDNWNRIFHIDDYLREAFPETSRNQDSGQEKKWQALQAETDAGAPELLKNLRDMLCHDDVPNNRTTHIVADAILCSCLAESPETGHSKRRCGKLEHAFRSAFSKRLESHRQFREWCTSRAASAPHHQPVPNAPVCVPILLETTVNSEKIGCIKWLVVELFRDGFVGLIPDLFTLGMTDIGQQPPGGGKSFLEHMDTVWDFSGLGSAGFCGRWRLLNRAPLNVDYVWPTPREDEPLSLRDISGNSAQAALMVALLAASGQVYEPVAALRQSAEPFHPVYLHLGTAITAGVEVNGPIPDDPRTLKLTEIGGLSSKHAAVIKHFANYDGSRDPVLRLDSVLLAAEEYDTEATNPNSAIRLANSEAARAERSGGSGLHYNPATTIQDALDAMLECNQWARLIRTATTTAWEMEWCYPRNKDQQILDRDGNVILDENNNPITRPDHDFVRERSVKTGSLEYMKTLANPALSREVRERLLGASEVDEVPDSNGGAGDSASEGDPV